ncbi:MAG: ABC transporter ATP-binding protein [Micropepsaceae bacterium]
MAGNAILSVRGLVKRFSGLLATDHVDLDLRAGEIHALIGPNGAGKSTLINQICGTLRPDAGSVRLRGEPIDRLDAAARAAKGIGRTFQIVRLIDEATVTQNLLVALHVRDGRIWRMFDGPGSRGAMFREAAERLAEAGLQDIAGTRVADLSHGYRKQLELVIARAMRPAVLLLDEPMAGLGQAESAEMVRTLSALRTEVPMLLVEHDMDAVFNLADRISVLVYGRVIATGSVAEIRENPEVRRAYLGEEDI